MTVCSLKLDSSIDWPEKSSPAYRKVKKNHIIFVILKMSFKNNLVLLLFSHVLFFVTPWSVVCQASLSITNSWSLLKFMSMEPVMPFKYLILCHPLLLLSSIFPGIRVFSSESVLHIRWPKYWSFSFSMNIPMNIQD